MAALRAAALAETPREQGLLRGARADQRGWRASVEGEGDEPRRRAQVARCAEARWQRATAHRCGYCGQGAYQYCVSCESMGRGKIRVCGRKSGRDCMDQHAAGHPPKHASRDGKPRNSPAS